MSRLLQIRLALAIIGIVVWGYGLLREEATVRLVGIVVLALSLVLRFIPRRFREEGAGREEGGEGTA